MCVEAIPKIARHSVTGHRLVLGLLQKNMAEESLIGKDGKRKMTEIGHACSSVMATYYISFF